MMIRHLLAHLLAAFGFLCAVVGEAYALGAADRMIESLASTQSLVADFSQTTVMASARLRTQSGTFWVSKPGLLRWEVKKPYAQLQILNGKEFWLYDPDLAQATVRPMSAANLTGIAALLLSSSSLSREDLMARYSFRNAGRRDGLEWVEVTPKKEEPGVLKILVGIDDEAIARRFEIQDALGQTTRVVLENVLKNTIIDSSQFEFTPPRGVAVLRTP